jgi:hypothetical protein
MTDFTWALHTLRFHVHCMFIRRIKNNMNKVQLMVHFDRDDVVVRQRISTWALGRPLRD